MVIQADRPAPIGGPDDRNQIESNATIAQAVIANQLGRQPAEFAPLGLIEMHLGARLLRSGGLDLHHGEGPVGRIFGQQVDFSESIPEIPSKQPITLLPEISGRRPLGTRPESAG